jgi:hypothetical protein
MLECPRCQSPLPDPEARFCTSCGAPLREGEASPPSPPGEPESLAPPTEPPPGPAGEERSTPWERRAEIGLGAAFLETTRAVVTRPQEFFRKMPLAGGLGGPLFYAVIAGYVGLLAAALYDYVFRSIMGTSLERFGRSSEFEKLMPMVPTWLGLVVQVVLGPVLVALFLFVFAAITHLMLMLLGGAQGDFEATFRVAAYARATHLLQIALGIIPCCGAIAVMVYEIVVATIGLAEVHRVTRGKAAAAILLPLLIFLCCITTLVGVMMWGALSAIGGTR